MQTTVVPSSNTNPNNCQRQQHGFHADASWTKQINWSSPGRRVLDEGVRGEGGHVVEEVARLHAGGLAAGAAEAVGVQGAERELLEVGAELP